MSNGGILGKLSSTLGLGAASLALVSAATLVPSGVCCTAALLGSFVALRHKPPEIGVVAIFFGAAAALFGAGVGCLCYASALTLLETIKVVGIASAACGLLSYVGVGQIAKPSS
jgi:hypothetical protein